MTSKSGYWDDEQFTIANIPYGVATRPGKNKPQIVTRLGSLVYFIPELISDGLLKDLETHAAAALQEPTLNTFATLSKKEQRRVRVLLQDLLTKSDQDESLQSCSCAYGDVSMLLPVKIGDFSDFSCSMEHVQGASEAIFGVREMPPGFLHFPGGYAGRASSVVVSGTQILRPLGQYNTSDGVTFGPSKVMDFELEVAIVVGKPSTYGQPVDIANADDHVFGLVLLNDWSARDIQALEMKPLGPFQGKSLGTTISPWIVTLDALEPFRTKTPTRQKAVAAYLDDPEELNHYAVQLKAEILTGETATTVCQSRLEWTYWNFRHLLAHQTINGCPIGPGDLLATGTVSGPEPGQSGCMLEICRGGKQSLKLSDGSERKALLDGDGVRLSGWAGDLGSDNCVGFGDCVGFLKGR